MTEVFILAGARTPIGAFQGALSTLTAPQLGAVAIRAALERAGVAPDHVDEVLMGNVLSAGMGQAPSRQASRGAGIPDSVPCTTINKVCGSGMKAVMMAAQAIKCGDASVVVAGGMESMTNAPYVLPQARAGYRMGHGTLVDSMIHDGLWDPYDNVHMGTCGDLCATEENFPREEVDAYAASSFERAQAAQKEGRLAEEIVPVSVPQRKGDPVEILLDEQPSRGDVTKLPSLRPAFGAQGVTTAGNASSINDGACALVIASGQASEGKDRLAQIVGYAQHAQEPKHFTTAPAAAIQKLLDAHGLKVDDIDLFEVNEAFSVVAMHAAKTVGIPREKLNVNGGAVSLGHPIGMSGARLVLTAAMELKRRGGTYAIATPCIGGGEATAVLIKRAE